MITKRVLISLLLLLFLIAGGWWQYQQLMLTPRQLSMVHVLVPVGSSLSAVSERLQQQKVIPSALAFRLYVRWQQQQSKIKAGAYVFDGQLNPVQVLQQLMLGQVQTGRLTIAEGLRTEQVFQHLARQTHTPLALWQQAADHVLGDEQEGVLLPETYQYTLPLRPQKILQRMQQAQQAVLKELQGEQALDHQKIRIMASIIEKETSLREERPLISSVIHNRLKLGMPLQMDPTVIYGRLRLHPQIKGRLHRRDLREDSPWNTYTRKGLPATPIGNPGRDSLRAAANPADTDFLFFVANGQGGHHFSSSLKAHQRNVRRWLKQQ